jgi:hypothetical protein
MFENWMPRGGTGTKQDAAELGLRNLYFCRVLLWKLMQDEIGWAHTVDEADVNYVWGFVVQTEGEKSTWETEAYLEG